MFQASFLLSSGSWQFLSRYVSLLALDTFLYHTIEGIIGILINGLLVYGANARNSTAILVWIVLAVIESVYLCLIVILFSIFSSSFRKSGKKSLI